ncbi:hypothetical protein CRV01_04355, partial [Arcobacter sp. CECT 8983]|uniref:hypothetical protein n=1 Tax=Arcobacter sp. CECT 8983 TaxID=2044508 RepID=UPI00102705C2
NDAFEDNLKLYFESKRKDLDILLTSTIPTQKNLMKTILWLNSSILAFTITLLGKQVGIIFLSIPFIFSFISIFHILFSLTDGRAKSFGTIPLENIKKIPQNKNERIQALYDMNTCIDIAFKNNSLIIKKRANKIGLATKYTIVSVTSIFFAIVFYVNIYLMKGG